MFTSSSKGSSSKGKTGMKREGRQPSMVCKDPVLGPSFHPRPEPRFTNRHETLLKAGLFAKVSQNHTNQSKFMGKPSRPKSGHVTKEKGTQNLPSCHVVSNRRLVSWWAVDSSPRLKFAGFSSSEVLAHLDSDYLTMGGDDNVVEVFEESCEFAYRDSLEWEIASRAVDIKDCDEENKGDIEFEDLGFYDAEIVWADEDEDGSCYLVVEM